MILSPDQKAWIFVLFLNQKKCYLCIRHELIFIYNMFFKLKMHVKKLSADTGQHHQITLKLGTGTFFGRKGKI